jgi:hypothetical protein
MGMATYEQDFLAKQYLLRPIMVLKTAEMSAIRVS